MYGKEAKNICYGRICHRANIIFFYTIIIFFHLASTLRQESFLFISVDTGVQIFPGRLDICLN